MLHAIFLRTLAGFSAAALLSFTFSQPGLAQAPTSRQLHVGSIVVDDNTGNQLVLQLASATGSGEFNLPDPNGCSGATFLMSEGNNVLNGSLSPSGTGLITANAFATTSSTGLSIVNAMNAYTAGIAKVGVAVGGTGLTSVAANRLLVGNGTSAFGTTANTTASTTKYLTQTADGSGNPGALQWLDAPSGGSGINYGSATSSLTNLDAKLFDVSYSPSSGANAAGAAITSNGSTGTTGDATGLTLSSIAKTGQTSTALSLSATGGATNTALNISGGDVLFNAEAHSISLSTAGASTAGSDLTLAAGAAGTGGNFAGGNLVLEGGARTGSGSQGRVQLLDSHLQSKQTTAPTAALGNKNPNTGTTPGSVTLTNATDVAGLLTVHISSDGGTGLGSIANVTFNKPYKTAPVVLLTAANAATPLGFYADQIYATATTTSFSIMVNSYAAANKTYAFYYQIIETGP